MSDKWDKDDLIYAAGFLDGEGSFFINEKDWKISVSCTNTNKPIIEWFKKTFGGSICKNATQLRKLNHRRCFSWQIVCQDAENLCKAIVPYLHEKTEQALLLIALRQTVDTKIRKRLSSDIILERQWYSNHLKELKHVSWK